MSRSIWRWGVLAAEFHVEHGTSLLTGYHGICEDDGVTAAMIALTRLMSANPLTHPDCDDPDCPTCVAELDAIERLLNVEGHQWPTAQQLVTA